MDPNYRLAMIEQSLTDQTSKKQFILKSFETQLQTLKQKLNSKNLQSFLQFTQQQQQLQQQQIEPTFQPTFVPKFQPIFEPVIEQPFEQQFEMEQQQEIQQIEEEIAQNYNHDNDNNNDDEDKNLENLIEFSIEGKSNYTQLSKTQSQQIPVVINLITKVPPGLLKRPPIDLICVIDVSGSMEGEKLQLVQQTLQFMIKELDSQDRLALIKFDNQSQILCNLLNVVPENQQTFLGGIQQLIAQGGTNISAGIESAMEIIEGRMDAAPVTGIFLLSDGQDWNALNSVSSNSDFQSKKDSSNFVLHTFGFGSDHDPNLMRDLSKLTNGSFYYISELNLVEECFIDASTGLSSVIANNTKLKVKCVPNIPFLTDLRISKCYGNWVYNSDENYYELNINQLLCGAKRNYVIEINLPPVKRDQLPEGMKNQVGIIEATLTADSVKKPQKYDQTITFRQNLFAEEEELKLDAEELKLNEEVIINHLRVKAAESLQTAQQEADNYKFTEAQQILTEILQEIKESGLQDTSLPLQVLVKDIQQTQQNCNQNNYCNTRTMLIARQYQHMNQQSQPMDRGNLDEQTIYASHFQTITRTIRAQPREEKKE